MDDKEILEDLKVVRTARKLQSAKERVKKIFGGILLLLVVLVVGFCLGWHTYARRMEEKQVEATLPSVVDGIIEGEDYKITISNIEEVLKPASELVTTKYFYKDADIYENYKEAFGKKIPFTTDKAVFTYEGTVSVGIELAEVGYEIDNENKAITIKMPKIKVLSNEIDESSFQYPYVEDSIFNATVMEDYTSLLAGLKEDKEKEVNDNKELLKTAEENAKNVLKNFLTSSDVTKDYVVNFK